MRDIKFIGRTLWGKIRLHVPPSLFALFRLGLHALSQGCSKLPGTSNSDRLGLAEPGVLLPVFLEPPFSTFSKGSIGGASEAIWNGRNIGFFVRWFLDEFCLLIWVSELSEIFWRFKELSVGPAPFTLASQLAHPSIIARICIAIMNHLVCLEPMQVMIRILNLIYL